MNTSALRIRLQPKQSELLELLDDSEFSRLGFGGARGGSKSGGSRRCMILRRMEYERTTGLIIRRSLKELEQSHILKMFEEFPELRSGYREQKKQLTFPNGSSLFFGSAPTEKDIADFCSSEYADILIDEAQELSQGEMERLSGSNRCTSNQRITPKMIYAFMPGISESGLPPKGLHYLKRVFVDGELRGEESQERWAFLQAFSWDNIEWARKELAGDGVSEEEFYSWNDKDRREYFLTRTEYGRKLSALTNKGLREAWLFGKWDTFQGQYFPNFSYEQHTVEPSAIDIKPWHRRWVSCDWGFDHPSCVLWHSEDEEGRVTTYRELHVREMTSADLGEEISRLSEGEKIVDFVMSWDAFGKLDPRTRESLTVQLGKHLSRNVSAPRPADSSPGSRISGWRLMYELLDSGSWRISRDCQRLIECLPTLVRDLERNSEDVLKVDWSENAIGDDPADAARYGLQNMVRPAQKPFEVTRREVIRDAAGLNPDLPNFSPEKPNYTHAFLRDMQLQDERKRQGKQGGRSKSFGGRRRYI